MRLCPFQAGGRSDRRHLQREAPADALRRHVHPLQAGLPAEPVRCHQNAAAGRQDGQLPERQAGQLIDRHAADVFIW